MCHPEVPAGTIPPDVETHEIAIPLPTGERMPGLLALPESTAPSPAVLVMCDIFGRGSFYENLAQRLAQAGFVAYTPEQFFREGPLSEQTLDAARARRERFDEKQNHEDYKTTINWLKARPEVAGGPVGAVGFCMGGTSVLQMSALWPEGMAAGVCYYGFPASSAPGMPSPIDLAGRMRSPVLGVWGDQDEGVGMHNVETLRQKLQTAEADFNFKVYPGLGHGFLKSFLEDESEPGYHEACESWTMALDFLRHNLRVPAAASA